MEEQRAGMSAAARYLDRHTCFQVRRVLRWTSDGLPLPYDSNFDTPPGTFREFGLVAWGGRRIERGLRRKAQRLRRHPKRWPARPVERAIRQALGLARPL